MDINLEVVQDAVNQATLSAERRHGLLWSLDQLPGLYEELDRTSDSRHFDRIFSLVQGMLKALGDKDVASPDAPKVLNVIYEHFRDMHERLGIQLLSLKLAVPPKKAAAKKVVKKK